MSKPKIPDWLGQYFTSHPEVCPSCQKKVDPMTTVRRNYKRFHVCGGSYPNWVLYELSNSRPPLSFDVCNVTNCDSARAAGTEVWQKRGKAALLLYYASNNIGKERCSYHQPLAG